MFASDLYSLGITMYQMLTGVLPYDTPSPADLEKLYRGDLISPPRLKNQLIPKRINDIIMKALAPDIGARYQRAGDLLEDLLAARPLVMKRVTPDPREARQRAWARPAAARGLAAGRVRRRRGRRMRASSRASRRGCARERRRRRASAGSAARRCIRGLDGVRFAASRSSAILNELPLALPTSSGWTSLPIAGVHGLCVTSAPHTW